MYTKFKLFILILFLFSFNTLISVSLYAESDILIETSGISNSKRKFLSTEFNYIKSHYIELSIWSGALYGLSKVPKYLGFGYLFTIPLGNYDSSVKEITFMYIPASVYNICLTPNEITKEDQWKIFKNNAGLIIAGHYAYKILYKNKKEPPKLTINPVLLPNYNGVMLTKTF